VTGFINEVPAQPARIAAYRPTVEPMPALIAGQIGMSLAHECVAPTENSQKQFNIEHLSFGH